MTTLPSRFASVILGFAGLFRQRAWLHVEQLLMGALLVPGARTVAIYRIFEAQGRLRLDLPPAVYDRSAPRRGTGRFKDV